MIETILKTQELHDRRKKLVPNALGIFNPSSVKNAHDATLIDADGKKYIDFAGGIGVLNAGHCPAPVVQAIKDQADKFIHTCFNVSIYEQYLIAAEKMVEVIPHGEATKVMFVNSGAEAVENAIKIARQATNRSAIICFEKAFHGRTLMATTLTSKVGYKTGIGPFAPEVYRCASPTANDINDDSQVDFYIRQLKDFFHTHISAKEVAAIILEPVQGEGGFHVVPKKYMQQLRNICDEHGILLILDEVQTGFGRTGEWAAFHHYDVIPDLSTWAKSMGSGMPIGAVMGKANVMDNINPGTIGGTYCGNPLCCVAVSATIDYMKEINLNAKGKHVGEILKKRFNDFKNKFASHITEVRGLGAMRSFELSIHGDINKPDTELCKKVIQRCYEKGLIVISAGIYGNVIRNLAPLVINDEELNKGLDILEESLKELTN